MRESLVFEEHSTAIIASNPNKKKKKHPEGIGTDRKVERESPYYLPTSGKSPGGTRRVAPANPNTKSEIISRCTCPNRDFKSKIILSTSTESIIKKQFLPNGDIYAGSFAGTLPNGTGKYIWTDGCTYSGDWKRGKASGKGKFSWPSGATYEGEFKSGRMEGFGTFVGSDGDTYIGSWSSDRKHGYGQKRYANGDFYEGWWRKNLQDGQGRYVWKNGNEYVGEWKNGVIWGRGVLIWDNGKSRYNGHWDHGVPNGNGVFRWLDGSCYVGFWNKDLNNCNHQLKGRFYPGPPVKELQKKGVFLGSNDRNENENVLMARKRSSSRSSRSSVVESERSFPRICIWESDGEAGDITCDIVDNVEASMFYRDGSGVGCEGFRQFRRNPCCFPSADEVKKPGETISKGHKNYDLMLNVQLGIR